MTSPTVCCSLITLTVLLLTSFRPSVHTERPGIAGCQPLRLASHYRMGDGQIVIQRLRPRRLPIYLVSLAPRLGFEPKSRTFVGWHTIHCANTVYIKLTDKVFSSDRPLGYGMGTCTPMAKTNLHFAEHALVSFRHTQTSPFTVNWA